MTAPEWAEDIVAIFPGAVPADLCSRIVSEGLARPFGPGPLHNTKTGARYFDPTVRAVQVSWFEGGWIADFMRGLLARANDEWGYVVTGMDPVQFARYGKHDFFEWHSDFRFVRRGPIRKLSVVVQLDPPGAYRGGELAFSRDGSTWAPETFRPQGSVAVFASLINHRVTPVKEGERRSLTAWFTGPPFR